MGFLNNLAKTEFYINLEMTEQLCNKEMQIPFEYFQKIPKFQNFKEKVAHFKLPNRLISTLEKEFNLLKEKIQNIITKI